MLPFEYIHKQKLISFIYLAELIGFRRKNSKLYLNPLTHTTKAWDRQEWICSQERLDPGAPALENSLFPHGGPKFSRLSPSESHDLKGEGVCESLELHFTKSGKLLHCASSHWCRTFGTITMAKEAGDPKRIALPIQTIGPMCWKEGWFPLRQGWYSSGR